jgi:biofilm PGA synthesis N-glycosyltransferase PgaC
MQKSERPDWVPESGQSAKSELYTFTIGICATGRPPALQALLASVLLSDFRRFAMMRLVLVASDMEAESLEVAKRFAAREPRMLLIEHKERTGKADAINEVFRETEGDFLVYVNADAMVTPSSILALLDDIEDDPRVGFVSGRPVFERPKGMVSDVLELMWTSFNLLSADPDQAANANHGTDELMVIRSELLVELPRGVVNDGAFIAGRIRERGFSVGYQPNATVQIDVPRRMVDLIGQRRRILYGHMQVKRLVGKVPRTVETMMFFSPIQSVKIVIRELAGRPRLILALPAAGVGEILAVCGALWDTLASKSHAVWKRYDQ